MNNVCLLLGGVIKTCGLLNYFNVDLLYYNEISMEGKYEYYLSSKSYKTGISFLILIRLLFNKKEIKSKLNYFDVITVPTV